VRIVSVNQKKAIFSWLDLVLCLLIEDLDPFDANLAARPTFLLISNATKMSAQKEKKKGENSRSIQRIILSPTHLVCRTLENNGRRCQCSICADGNNNGGIFSGTSSAWKSSPKTGKRLRPDWTLTDQDRKISGPIKTATAVRSSVPLHLAKLKTDQNRFKPVVTGLSGPKNTGR
jgi:hypothetical protein